MPDMSKGDTRLILNECRRHGLLRTQAAYVLATAWLETARSMKPVREAYYLGEPRAEAYRKTLRYYPHYGRGFVQLTWDYNYAKAEKKLGAPFSKDLDLAMEPKHAATILVRGMVEGWFTGKKLSDYITRTKTDYTNARRIVNGTDRSAEFAKVAHEYDRQLLAEAYGKEPPPPPKPTGFWAWLRSLFTA